MDAAVRDLDRRRDCPHSSDQLSGFNALGREILVEEDRDFSFHFWLNQPALGYVFTRFERHVREQHAVIGLIDPKLLLYGLRRQPDLTADERAPAVEPISGVRFLDRIGSLDVT